MPQREVHGLILEFVFADGVLAYDCVACGARCCKAGDFYMDVATELEPLRAFAPNLAPFVSALRSNQTVLGVTHQPGCWFLDATNRCALQERGLKPFNCLLFPTNHLGVIGDHVYVDVALTCPLGLRDVEGRVGTLVTHDSIHELLRRHPGARRFAAKPPGYGELNQDLETLLACLREHAAGWREDMPWSAAYAALCERIGAPIGTDEVTARLGALHALFATEPCAPGPAARLLDESFTALTPSLLFHRQWPEVETRSSRAELHAWLAERLEALLGVRYLCEVAASLSLRSFGTGGVASLYTDSHVLARTIGLAHHPVQAARDRLPLKVPPHLESVGRELYSRIETGTGSILDHLRAMGVPPFEARSLLELITANLSR